MRLSCSKSLKDIINKNNKYKIYVAHIQQKYFHMRITDDKIKISRIKSYHKNVSRLNSMLKSDNNKIKQKQIKTKKLKINE